MNTGQEGENKMSIWQLKKDTQDTPSNEEAQPDKVRQLASAFHAIGHQDDTSPDWQELLLEAKNGEEKMKIRAMRETWEAEQKFLAYQKAQEAQEARIKEVLSHTHRNKFFYERLLAEQPSVYWSEQCQRLMRKDKQTMGLSYHLKG